jgi:hypothetical protein
MIYWPLGSTVTGVTGRRTRYNRSVFSAAWKIFQLFANPLQLQLNGNANTARASHGALNLTLTPQQALQIGLELHRRIPS